MPAANFVWCINDQSSVCHPYGTKRKSTVEENEDDYNEMTEAAAKRRCTEMTQMPCPQQQVQCMEMSELACQDQPNQQPHIPQSYHQHHPSLSVHQPYAGGDNNNVFSINNTGSNPDTVMCQQFIHHRVEENNNHIPAVPPQSFSQNEMIMDLNDEVFTTVDVNLTPSMVTTDAEYEAACNMMAAMEDEGAPNPEQYRPAPSSHAQNISSDIQSMRAGVLCLSKSSFNGMADMQPYISDYY